MKARSDVVQMPEIVTLRRSVQAAHTAWKEASHAIRSEGTPLLLAREVAPGRRFQENEPARNPALDEPAMRHAEWDRLTREYEARVIAEMATELGSLPLTR